MKVRDVMTSTVVTASPGTTFPDLLDLLIRHGVAGLPVVDADGNLVGIVTEADLVSKEAYGGHRRRLLEILADLVAGGQTEWAIKARGLIAAHLMTAKVSVVQPDDDLRSAARLMVEEHRKSLPVVDGQRLVGIVSRIDVLRVLHRSDADLERDVAVMLADPSRAPEGHEVHADVRDGVVRLRGTVRFPADLEVLSAVVWRVPGVVAVRNETISREPEPRLV